MPNPSEIQREDDQSSARKWNGLGSHLLFFIVGVLVTLAVSLYQPPTVDGIREYGRRQKERLVVYVGYDEEQEQPVTFHGNPGLYPNYEAYQANWPRNAMLVWTADSRADAAECARDVARFVQEWKPRRTKE